MQNKQTIIITGGTGFIGSHTYLELVNNYNKHSGYQRQ